MTQVYTNERSPHPPQSPYPHPPSIFLLRVYATDGSFPNFPILLPLSIPSFYYYMNLLMYFHLHGILKRPLTQQNLSLPLIYVLTTSNTYNSICVSLTRILLYPSSLYHSLPNEQKKKNFQSFPIKSSPFILLYKKYYKNRLENIQEYCITNSFVPSITSIISLVVSQVLGPCSLPPNEYR